MIVALFVAVATLCLAGAAHRAITDHRFPPRDPSARAGRRALLVVFAGFGLTCALLAAENIGGVLGGVFRLVGNLANNLAALAVLVLLLVLRESWPEARRQVRGRAVGCALVSLVMIVLFVTASAQVTFGDLLPTRPQLVLYTVLFSLYLAVAMSDVVRLAVTQIPAVRRTHLAPGLTLAATGAGFYLAYCLYKIVGAGYAFLAKASNVGEPSGLCVSPVQSVACTMTISCPLLAVVLLLAGVAYPHWWPALSAPWRRTRYRRDIAALDPLWTPLIRAGLAHELPVGNDPANDGSTRPMPPQLDLGQQRYRRLIEIRDGLSALSDYQHHADTERADRAAAAEQFEDDAEIVREAERTRLALEHHERAEPGDLPAPPPLVRIDATDLETDLRRLIRVAHALAAQARPKVDQ